MTQSASLHPKKTWVLIRLWFAPRGYTYILAPPPQENAIASFFSFYQSISTIDLYRRCHSLLAALLWSYSTRRWEELPSSISHLLFRLNGAYFFLSFSSSFFFFDTLPFVSESGGFRFFFFFFLSYYIYSTNSICPFRTPERKNTRRYYIYISTVF